jgi:isopenicillin N synthase-like dioxygenase
MEEFGTANLETVSFAKLAAKDPEEVARVLRSCEQQGFFYLELADSYVSRGVLDRLEALSLAKKWFESPMEEKLKFRQDSVTRGYVNDIYDF